jgi:hypothetical protein
VGRIKERRILERETATRQGRGAKSGNMTIGVNRGEVARQCIVA